MGVMIPIAVGVIVSGLLVAAALRARRKRKQQVPELNQHPERLEQMLDPTDDA
jgi:heme/copper-type cytochrome/quinol oxidase subunit 2